MANEIAQDEVTESRVSVDEQLDALTTIIRKHGDIAPQSIADELGVSLRTVYRYLRRLKQSDLLKTSYSRRQSKHTIHSQDSLRPVRFTQQEALALQAACCNSERLTSNKLSPALQHGLLQIRDAAHDALDAGAQRWLDDFEPVDDCVRRNLPAYYQIILTLHQAFTNRHKVQLRYWQLGKSNPEELIVHPLHVTLHKGTWYLMAFSEKHGETHLFQIALIHEAVVVTERFRKPSKMDAQKRFERCLVSVKSHQEPQVILRFSAKVAGAVKQLSGLRLHIDQEMSDGGLLCSLEPYGSGEMIQWILGWGVDVEVLQPEEFRRDLARVAATLLRRYGAALNS